MESIAPRWLFTGDSITDAGRERPVGDSNVASLGNGYVMLLDAILNGLRPERAIGVLNTGVSGDRSKDLLWRWNEDVMQYKPDLVSVMIGTNDVWRQFDSPLEPDAGVSPGEYEGSLWGMVRKIEGKGVLMTPFMIEPNPMDEMRSRMDEYGEIVAKVAAESGVKFVNTQAVFDEVLEELPGSFLSWDRIHPGMKGHMVLARAFLDGVEPELSGEIRRAVKGLSRWAGKTVAFVGDSITDCGRDRGCPESSMDRLGNGYVAMINALVVAYGTSDLCRIRNLGVGGDTVKTLAVRWKEDVLDSDPDVVCLCLGINDSSYQFGFPFHPERHVSLEEYGDGLRGFADSLVGKELVFMSPFYLEPDKQNPQRVEIGRYAEVMKQVAGEYGATFVDFQNVVDGVLAHLPYGYLAWDRAHAAPAGHMALAYGFLEGLTE